jgi:hypothetical protein
MYPDHFNYYMLTRGVVASTMPSAIQASRFPHRVLQRPIKQKRKGLRYYIFFTMQIVQLL